MPPPRRSVDPGGIMMRAFLHRELAFFSANPWGYVVGISFFILLSTCLHWVGVEDLSKNTLGGLFALLMIFSFFLTSEVAFHDDFRTGFLEELITSHISLTPYVFSKALSFWLGVGLPLSLCAPLLMTMYHPGASNLGVFLALSPLFCLLTLLGSALTLGLTHQKSLMFFFMLPFYIPLFLVMQGLLTGEQAYTQLLLGLALIYAPLTFLATMGSLKYATVD